LKAKGIRYIWCFLQHIFQIGNSVKWIRFLCRNSVAEKIGTWILQLEMRIQWVVWAEEIIYRKRTLPINDVGGDGTDFRMYSTRATDCSPIQHLPRSYDEGRER
jgi:uncharacterized protein YpiB (UPF0302 family)